MFPFLNLIEIQCWYLGDLAAMYLFRVLMIEFHHKRDTEQKKVGLNWDLRGTKAALNKLYVFCQ